MSVRYTIWVVWCACSANDSMWQSAELTLYLANNSTVPAAVFMFKLPYPWHYAPCDIQYSCLAVRLSVLSCWLADFACMCGEAKCNHTHYDTTIWPSQGCCYCIYYVILIIAYELCIKDLENGSHPRKLMFYPQIQLLCTYKLTNIWFLPDFLKACLSPAQQIAMLITLHQGGGVHTDTLEHDYIENLIINEVICLDFHYVDNWLGDLHESPRPEFTY